MPKPEMFTKEKFQNQKLQAQMKKKVHTFPGDCSGLLLGWIGSRGPLERERSSYSKSSFKDSVGPIRVSWSIFLLKIW